MKSSLLPSFAIHLSWCLRMLIPVKWSLEGCRPLENGRLPFEEIPIIVFWFRIFCIPCIISGSFRRFNFFRADPFLCFLQSCLLAPIKDYIRRQVTLSSSSPHWTALLLWWLSDNGKIARSFWYRQRAWRFWSLLDISQTDVSSDSRYLSRYLILKSAIIFWSLTGYIHWISCLHTLGFWIRDPSYSASSVFTAGYRSPVLDLFRWCRTSDFRIS